MKMRIQPLAGALRSAQIGRRMKKWLENLRHFYTDKIYMLLLGLSAVCSYGFLITHHTVGIDDTPFAYYFEEGLAAIVGRWVLFLLNKVVHIAEFAPFLTDFAAVLILMAAVTVWCALFYSILGESVPKWGYRMFACLFLSCPLLSEVFTYYLHNGVALGYLCCGISLCFFREGMLRWQKIRNSLPCFAASAVFLFIALGCYESFMTVWLPGLCLVLLSGRFAGEKTKVFRALCIGAVTALLGLLLRSVMINVVTAVFGLEALQDEAVQRSVSEMAAWMFEPGALSEFAMVVKRIFVMYGVFAYAYYPIQIFLLASAVIAAYCIYRSIRKRDLWTFVLCIGAFAAAFLLVIVEGKATLYRSAQFLPVICGYGALVFLYACRGLWERTAGRNAEEEKASVKNEKRFGAGVWRGLRQTARAAATGILCVILCNQCADMNHWFYVDYLKYEDAKNTMNQVAYEIEKHFDASKPVVFTGTYEIPRSIVQDAYVAYHSDVYDKMLRLTSLVDAHLLEKFYREYGVWVAQTPSLSVIDWGRYAFGTDEELVRFAAMHGHELKPLLDTDYAPIEEYAKELPEFPAEGSIVDAGEYLIVHF